MKSSEIFGAGHEDRDRAHAKACAKAGGFARAFASEAARDAAREQMAQRAALAAPAPQLALPAPKRPEPAPPPAPESTAMLDAPTLAPPPPPPPLDQLLQAAGEPERQLRPVTAIKQTHRLKPAPVPPPPRISWIPLSQLVIDDGYQRTLSNAGIALIRRLVEKWDWNMFKPLSVAPAGGGALRSGRWPAHRHRRGHPWLDRFTALPGAVDGHHG